MLRPGGFLLDIHPEPLHAAVEVQVGGQCQTIGHLDETDLIGRVHTARRVVAWLVETGYFAREQSSVFEFVYYFESVDEWLAYMAEEWASAVIAPSLVTQARELLDSGRGELRVRERVYAAGLRRL